MSEIAPHHPPVDRLTPLAFALAVGAVVVWVLAGAVDDALYALDGALGIAAFVVGARARREARRAGSQGWPALASMVVGGLLGTAFVIFTAFWGLSQLW